MPHSRFLLPDGIDKNQPLKHSVLFVSRQWKVYTENIPIKNTRSVLQIFRITEKMTFNCPKIHTVRLLTIMSTTTHR